MVITGPGTRGAKGLCLEVHDLLLSKYVAAREKDARFCGVAVAQGLADPATLFARLGHLPVDEATRTRIERMIRHDASARST